MTHNLAWTGSAQGAVATWSVIRHAISPTIFDFDRLCLKSRNFALHSAKGAECIEGVSAKGAEYDSQGQALSAAKRVAPGYKSH